MSTAVVYVIIIAIENDENGYMDERYIHDIAPIRGIVYAVHTFGNISVSKRKQ